MKTNDIAIAVKNMSKDFKRVYDKPQTLKERLLFWKNSKKEYHHVLKNINLEIEKGETVALIGTNGSGKSTLLKLMTKIIYPNKGLIETNGKLTSLLELGAGFHPDFTGRENIYFNASIFGLTRKEIDARMQDIIDFSELKDFIDNPVRTYSSGMYMRLAFSIAINVDAEILLIDEILAVGDQHFQDKCFERLEQLRDSDKTIVIVSHSLDMIKKLCNRAIWIYKGEVKMDGAPREVIREYLYTTALDALNNEENDHRKFDHTLSAVCIDDLNEDAIQEKNGKKTLKISGWLLKNIDSGTLKVLVNSQEMKCNYHFRPDLLYNFQDTYNSKMNKEAGWSVEVDIKKNEKYVVECCYFDEKGNVLAKQERTLSVDEM